MYKKFSLLAGLLLLSMSTVVIYKTVVKKPQKTHQSAEFPFNSPCPIESIETWLTREESTLWQEVQQAIGLSKQDCEKLKKEWYKDFKYGEMQEHERETSQKPLSQSIINQVLAILNDFNITAQQLPLRSWKDSSAAAVTDSILFINEKTFSGLPPESQKFVIGHEIQHFLYKDNSTNYVIEQYYKPAQKTLPQNHPVNKLHRFQELRADIISALHGPEYAHGYRLYIQNLAKKGENAGITHPKNSLRLTVSNNLLRTHNIA